nr:serine protease [Microlunatus panaciterrae]
MEYGPQPNRGRRTLAIALSVCGAALVLGVGVALILNATGLVGLPRVHPQPGVSTSAPSLPGPSQNPTASADGSASPTADKSSPAAPASSLTPAPPDFPAVFALVRSGVVRVLASTCDGTGVGTGFLVGDRTVVTSLQSVSQAVATVVVTSSGPVVARVTSTDQTHGVAVLTLDDSVSGYHFTVKAAQPKVGEAVGVVGLPSRRRAADLSVTTVSSVDESAATSSRRYSGLARVTGSADPGLGGAPVVDGDGAVIGMIFAHPEVKGRVLMPGGAIRKSITAPSGAKAKTGHCRHPKGDPRQTVITGGSGRLTRLLQAYFGGLNDADYQQAYNQLGPKITRTGSLKDFEPGWVSSYDFNIVVRSSSSGRAWVTFDSIFAQGRGPKGTTTCARWSLDYTLTSSNGRLLINGANKHAGAADFFTPC